MRTTLSGPMSGAGIGQPAIVADAQSDGVSADAWAVSGQMFVHGLDADRCGGISTHIWTCSRDNTPETIWTPSSLPTCRIIVRIRSRDAPSSIVSRYFVIQTMG
jgi:hypothetical protein